LAGNRGWDRGAIFKRKENDLLEDRAMQEYKANIEATKQKAARLRALRLARTRPTRKASVAAERIAGGTEWKKAARHEPSG
jgi:hypothetical protein